ncbi:hypothetical protein [Chryseobacterium vrystaatense]|uniref:Uncharacterized protein n=1 Tax=Chryseobacterium vrystaatense TaxID=307480 RepID=A0ABR4UQ75_9FLAO|nr:hypothetical protein [Chryseobacterium vrystaatense]KFF27269.1 hypothetical protein IW16_08440 [Chryseobacterium vrystaatense]
MIIIRRKNNSFINLVFLFILLLCNSCKSQAAISSDKICMIATSNKEMILEVGDNEILKKELKGFYNDSNIYDIIFYKSKSGDVDVTFSRIYKNKDNKWFYIKISNSKIIIQKQIEINNSDFEILFNNFENISMYKNCGMCFGCYNYFNLIKKNDKRFSYYYDSLSGNLSDGDLAKLEPYLKILNFFNQYNLE